MLATSAAGRFRPPHAVTYTTLNPVSTDARSERTFKGIEMPCLIKSHAKHRCNVAVLRKELNAAGVSQSAENELLRRLAPTKTDIVKR